MTEQEKPRWHYRFDNFKRAYVLLREGIEAKQDHDLSQLEKEGVIQRFEYTIELAWKTMKDYLESQNVVFDQITPRSVIKEAFAAKIIQNGQVWMNALDARNKMSHTYDFKKFEEVILDIEADYLHAVEELYFYLLAQVMESPYA
jgi:nucleotidyltransferase substrate binding protein (TIGR01987 family)